MQLGNTSIFGKDLPVPAHYTVQPDAYLGPRPPGRLRRPTAVCPIPRAPTPRWHSRPPATSSPHAAHAAATSSCVSRLYPLRSCHTKAKFPFVSSPLASAPFLPLELAITTLPDHPSSSEPRNQTPTFPSPRRTPLELALRTSGPGARSSPAAASSASPATVDRRLRCSSGLVDTTSSIARALRCSLTSPTEPTTAGRPPHRRTPPPVHHRRRDRAPVSLPPPFTSIRDRRRPSLLPGRFPADQWLPVSRIWPVSHRHRGDSSPPPPVSSVVERNAQGGWAAWPSPVVG
jgi:hypothetical protein